MNSLVRPTDCDTKEFAKCTDPAKVLTGRWQQRSDGWGAPDLADLVMSADGSFTLCSAYYSDSERCYQPASDHNFAGGWRVDGGDIVFTGTVDVVMRERYDAVAERWDAVENYVASSAQCNFRSPVQLLFREGIVRCPDNAAIEVAECNV